jgi:hypothetical protein
VEDGDLSLGASLLIVSPNCTHLNHFVEEFIDDNDDDVAIGATEDYLPWHTLQSDDTLDVDRSLHALIRRRNCYVESAPVASAHNLKREAPNELDFPLWRVRCRVSTHIISSDTLVQLFTAWFRRGGCFFIISKSR